MGARNGVWDTLDRWVNYWTERLNTSTKKASPQEREMARKLAQHKKKIYDLEEKLNKTKALNDKMTELSRNLQSEKERLELLKDFQETVYSSLDLKTLLETAASLVRSKVKGRACFIMLAEKEGKPKIAISRGLEGDKMDQGRQETIEMMAAQSLKERKTSLFPDPHQAQIRKALVPLYVGKETVGVLGVDLRARGESLLRREVEILENLTVPLSRALKNALAYHTATSGIEESHLIRRIADLPTKADNLPGLLEEVLNLVKEAIGYDSCTIYLSDNGNGSLRPALVRGKKINLMEHKEFAYGRGIASWVAQTGKLTLFDDLHQETERLKIERSGLHLRSFLASPLILDDKVVGVIALGASLPEAFTEADARLLANLSASMAKAAFKLPLHQQASEYRSRLERAPEEALKSASVKIDLLEISAPYAEKTPLLVSYLDWITSLPWGKSTKEEKDLKVIKEVLEKKFHGQEVIGELTEHLRAYFQDSVSGRGILIIVGPSGVGKNYLVETLARTVGRKLVRLPLGDYPDRSAIYGVDWKTPNSTPGGPAQKLSAAGVMNPVIALEDLDKINGLKDKDLVGAILAMTNRNENSRFPDYYLSVRVDLSGVLFLATAPNPSSIPAKIKNAATIIEIPGYSPEEKAVLARRHLIPKLLVQRPGIELTDFALHELIKSYTLEAGVENLERRLTELFDGVYGDRAQAGGKVIKVTRADVKRYLGEPEEYYRSLPQEEEMMGVAIALAWTEKGGDVIPIEVNASKGSGKLLLTGGMGSVMKESVQTAATFVRSRMRDLGYHDNFGGEYDLHVHIPRINTLKDGPSSGATTAVAIISALSGRYVRKDVAVTGEVTLKGQILPVGGLVEKVAAATRVGIKTVILPKANRRELDDLSKGVKEKVDFVLVERMDEVLKAAVSPSA